MAEGIRRQIQANFESMGLPFDTVPDVLGSIYEGYASAPWSYEIPIFRAAESGSAACIRHLIELGADPLARDNSQRTALWTAGSGEVVSLLVGLGLSLEDVDQYGWTPLDDAVGEGLEGLHRARWSIEAGANVNATHDRGYTVFMTAASAMERHVDMLRLLVASGADSHAVSELGYNAFHAAVDVNGEANDEASVRSVLGYLKELGVSLSQRNHRGQTPLERAESEGTELEAKVLRELMAKP